MTVAEVNSLFSDRKPLKQAFNNTNVICLGHYHTIQKAVSLVRSINHSGTSVPRYSALLGRL